MKILQANIEININIGAKMWTLYPGDTIHIIDEVETSAEFKSKMLIKEIHYKINNIDCVLELNKLVYPMYRLPNNLGSTKLDGHEFTDITIQWNRDNLLNKLI
jgi:hypothetical protein